MEINDKPARMEQLIESLPSSLPVSWESSLSLYSGGILTDRVQVEAVRSLKNAFPSLPLGFYDILMDRLRANGFNDARLRDAVNNVIDTCIYPTPTIANIISWDKRIKLHNYNEVCSHVDDGGRMDDFFKREVNGKMFWIRKTDAIQNGMPYDED